MHPAVQNLLRFTLASGVATLMACGGGGGGGGSNTASGGAAPPTGGAVPPIVPTTIAPIVPVIPSITVRASGSVAAGVWPVMEVRVDGVSIATVSVNSTTPTSYTFTLANALTLGSKVDVAFTNDAVINAEDRNLFVDYVQSGNTTVLSNASNVVYDRGNGAGAYDGLDVVASGNSLYANGALRFTWPAPRVVDAAAQARQNDASRFLQQASFGPTLADIDHVATIGAAGWIDEQMARPATADFVNDVDAQFARGDYYRPGQNGFDANIPAQKFWMTAVTGPDQLRKRTAFALNHFVMASEFDAGLEVYSRAYADYLDMLNRDAFGNFRTLMEDVALSPAMGMYLTYIRNQKEDVAAGRLPDENFAREQMQLFTIGLNELNLDGTLKLGADGQPIETYNNNDVMAMAKVFTGWSWGLPDAQLNDSTFLWGQPAIFNASTDQRYDLQRMKNYPGQHSTAAKTLFAGKANAVTLAAGGTAAGDLKTTLDTLFNHPNVGPFIGRRLIQNFVSSNPSPAYVARVATVFNDNGHGVRGDMAAVVRAVLLDAEARTTSPLGKLREPALRTAHWARAFAAASPSGRFKMNNDLTPSGQTTLAPGSVFGYFRPGYVPPNTQFSAAGITAPEFQILNEATVAEWINLAEAMAGRGIGWNGTGADLVSSYDAQIAIGKAGDIDGEIDQVNLLMLNGTMSSALRQDILNAMVSVPGADDEAFRNRIRAAVFLTLASPEYLVQR